MNIKYDVKSSAALRSTPKYSLVNSLIHFFQLLLFSTSGPWRSRGTAPYSCPVFCRFQTRASVRDGAIAARPPNTSCAGAPRACGVSKSFGSKRKSRRCCPASSGKPRRSPRSENRRR
jgi:hypothetical protein